MLVFNGLNHASVKFRSPWATDWSEYADAATPDDWTNRSGGDYEVSKTDLDSGYIYCVGTQGGTPNVHNLTWDKLGSTFGNADYDVLALINRGTFTDTPALCGLARCNTSDDGLTCGFNGSTSVAMTTYNNGIFQSTLDSASFTSVSGNWYFMRWRRSGNTHTGKFWALGDAEPATAQISATSSATHGNMGLMIVANIYEACAWFSAANGGDVAPLPAG